MVAVMEVSEDEIIRLIGELRQRPKSPERSCEIRRYREKLRAIQRRSTYEPGARKLVQNR